MSYLSTSPPSPSIFLSSKQVMNSYCSISCAVAASVGVLSHILYFVRGEHHKHTLQFLQILFYGFLSSSLILARVLQIPIVHGMQWSALVLGSYLTALWMSMFIYRFFFHPLNIFPGPQLAKLSKFYQFFTGLRLDAFRRSHKAHQKYGNFVRTGELIPSLRIAVFLQRSEPSRYFLYNEKSSQVLPKYPFSTLLSTPRPSKGPSQPKILVGRAVRS